MARTFFAFLTLMLAAEAGAAEICRFRALDAENPFLRWLASQEVTCVAAGAPVAIPDGLWNVFARGDAQVSSEPLLIEGGSARAAIEPPLAPGAVVVPRLPEGLGGVIYVPRRGSAVPIDGARVTVPADEPLWLFVVEKSKPVAVIPIAPPPAGSERAVDAQSGGAPAIVGWLRVPEPDRTAIAEATGVTSPVVRAGSREADPLPAPSRLHGAFVRIDGVAGPSVELRLEGRGWLPERRVLHDVGPGVTIASAPLFVRGAGTLTVHWNTDQDLPALERSVGSCAAERGVPQVVISISRCAPARPGQRFDSGECAEVRRETVGAFFGSFTFNDIEPGVYRAEMHFGKLPPARNSASVGPLRVMDLRVFGNWSTTYGSVTRGGEPLNEEVRIEFGGGVGYTSADAEDYQGVYIGDGVGPEGQITVAACDGSPRATVLADQRMRPRTRFNIDIPDNELEVRVTDTFTREALPGASMKLEAMAMLKPRRVVYTANESADEQGTVAMAAVPVREIHLTVRHAGYEPRRVEPFTMPKSGKHTVDVQLVPLRGTRGRIESSRPFDSGFVIWFSPTGSETDRAELAADGTFVHTNWHTPDETMAVVSASHPLWVLRSPATQRRGSIALRYPDAQPASFDVWLTGAVSRTAARYIGVAIGGVRIPPPVLAQHQNLRRNPPLLRGAGPQRVADLLATGPIEVMLGPAEEDVPSRMRALDFYVFPQFADLPRKRVEAGATDVVLSMGAQR